MKKTLKLPTRKVNAIEISNNLRLLFNEIKKYKTLTNEETNELFRQYKNATKSEKKRIFSKLVKHNLKFVVSAARAYRSNNDNVDDLIQEGCMGLIKSIETFDVEKGVPFSGYSLYWVRRYINLFKINYTPTIRKTNATKSYSTINKISNQLYQKLERTPTSEEIIDEYNSQHPTKKIDNTDDVCNVEYVFIDNIKQSTNENDKIISYKEMQLFNEKSFSENNYNDEIEKEFIHNFINKLLDCLNEKEKNLIKKKFGIDNDIPKTIESLSKEMGMTQQGVRQIYIKSIEKMKSKFYELHKK